MIALIATVAGIWSGVAIIAALLLARAIRIADDRMVTPGDVPSAERVSS